MKTLTLAAAAALLVLCLGVPASAQPGPAGAWNLALSVDSGSANPMIREVCLLNNGSWYSPSRDGAGFWIGLWYYAGGPVRLLGNFGTDSAVAMELTLVNGQSMVGTSTHWRGNANSQTDVSWARAVFTRTEHCWVVG